MMMMRTMMQSNSEDHIQFNCGELDVANQIINLGVLVDKCFQRSLRKKEEKTIKLDLLNFHFSISFPYVGNVKTKTPTPNTRLHLRSIQ